MNKDRVEKIKQASQQFYQGASGCHDWTHVERVVALVRQMADKEKADAEVLVIAAYLHDIARKEEMDSRGQICHAEAGAQRAKQILQKYDLAREKENNIIHCIAAHRSRNEIHPQSIEAKVLFDADKLDSLGAVGLGRIFLFAGAAGSGNLYTGKEKELAKTGKDFAYTKEDSGPMEYEYKIKYLKDKMLTQTGRIMAQERSEFMEQFFQRFWLEVEGTI